MAQQDSAQDKGKTEQLADAARALRAAPRDVRLWWELAAELVAAGHREEGLRAYAKLGNAACDTGAVALGISCALVLQKEGSEGKNSGTFQKEAERLIDRIAKVHGLKSKRIDQKRATIPPAPPSSPESSDSARNDDEGKSALELANQAISYAVDAVKQRTSKAIAPTPLVQFLESADLRKLAEVLEARSFSAGDKVVSEGEAADCLYWVSSGSLTVSRKGVVLGQIHGDAFFGEIALLGGSTRTADVVADDGCELLVIPEGVIESLAQKAPKLAAVLAGHARARLLSNVMRTSELFQKLSSEERRKLLPRFENRYAAEGDFLIRAGEDNNSLFVVVSGSCEVGDESGVLATLGPGDGFGEMSMLGRKAASYDVVASEASLLLEIARKEFDEVALTHPELLSEVYRLLVERERENADTMIHDASDLII